MEEARSWLLRLRDENVSVDEYAEWQSWLNEGSSHRDAYREVERLWTLSSAADLADLWPNDNELAKDVYAGEVSVARFWNARALVPARGALATASVWLRDYRLGRAAGYSALAAAAIAGVWLSFFIPQVGTIHFAQEVATQRGEDRNIVLSDGSTVDAGGASDIRLNFTGNRRTVRLESGEAYFKVVHDKRRPFIVETKLGNIVDIGTEFDVRLAGNRVVVSVIKGKVDVHLGASDRLSARVTADKFVADGKSIQLQAGRAVVLTEKHATVAIATEPAQRPSWRGGHFAYRAEPIKYVVADLNRYSRQQVIISDPKIGEYKFSGTLNVDSLGEWVIALQGAFPVSVETEADGSYVISPK